MHTCIHRRWTTLVENGLALGAKFRNVCVRNTSYHSCIHQLTIDAYTIHAYTSYQSYIHQLPFIHTQFMHHSCIHQLPFMHTLLSVHLLAGAGQNCALVLNYMSICVRKSIKCKRMLYLHQIERKAVLSMQADLASLMTYE
jgi:hypothetical protein